MKLGPVTKFNNRNKATSKKLDLDVISKNCDVIAIFSIYDQFRAIRKPDSGRMVCKIYIFINNNLLSYKRENGTENGNEKSLIQLSHIALSKGTKGL